MDEIVKIFIKSCLELGKELLDKDSLTDKEEEFLKQLDEITDKCINN